MQISRFQRTVTAVAVAACIALIASFAAFTPSKHGDDTTAAGEHSTTADPVGAARDSGSGLAKQATVARTPDSASVPGAEAAQPPPTEPMTPESSHGTAAASTRSSGASKIGAWRGAYVPHGWIASPKADEFVRDAVRDLSAAGFTHQIHNVGFLDEGGVLAAESYAGLDQWIRISRDEDPAQQIVLWISGDEDLHVNNQAAHGPIATFLADLMTRSGADGLMLDLEPFGQDNGNLTHLLAAMREQLPSTWIGLTAPATEGTWSAAFASTVATSVDAISPMLYDTSLTNPEAYQAFVASAIVALADATESKAALIPSLPAYAANRWHNPAVESIANAGVSLNAPSAPSVGGAAVYWWWEMDDTAKRDWLTAIGG